MSLRKRLENLPLFWKVYIFIVVLLIFVVGLGELMLEPLLKDMLHDISEEFQAWHEVLIWATSILIPSLACGYLLSKTLAVKLDKMVWASEELAAGKLEARLPVTYNDRDAFDILARSFNEMARGIERQIGNERRLLADISHELRSPLARMTIAAQLLLRRQDEQERAKLVLRLERELEQMGELVEMLLRQARERMEDSGPAVRTDLGPLLADLLDDFNFQAQAQGKRITSEYDENLQVIGNQLLLQRMLGNVLSNAIFYTPDNGEIIFTARKNNAEAQISVRDFGPGVPESQLADIFRAFYRADGSRARTSGGIGLGLALAREAAIWHGGGISARNAHPGLEIRVTLPLAPGGKAGR